MRIPVLPEGEEAEVGEEGDDDGGGAVEAHGGADDADDDDAERQRDEPHAPRHQVGVVGEGLQVEQEKVKFCQVYGLNLSYSSLLHSFNLTETMDSKLFGSPV